MLYKFLLIGFLILISFYLLRIISSKLFRIVWFSCIFLVGAFLLVINSFSVLFIQPKLTDLSLKFVNETGYELHEMDLCSVSSNELILNENLKLNYSEVKTKFNEKNTGVSFENTYNWYLLLNKRQHKHIEYVPWEAYRLLLKDVNHIQSLKVPKSCELRLELTSNEVVQYMACPDIAKTSSMILRQSNAAVDYYFVQMNSSIDTIMSSLNSIEKKTRNEINLIKSLPQCSNDVGTLLMK